MQKVTTKKQARQLVGGLSKTSKMPGFSYGLPAKECKTGSKLRKSPNSVCHGCYAMKGCYTWPVVLKAQYGRLESINNPLWVDAMVKLISDQKYFRWHDSGDLVDMHHLNKIIEICKLTPNTKHWLPTKEYKLVKDYNSLFGEFPSNLIVRVSSPNVNQKPVKSKYTSTVHTIKGEPMNGFECLSSDQEGECRECRACWNKEILNVSYLKH